MEAQAQRDAEVARPKGVLGQLFEATRPEDRVPKQGAQGPTFSPAEGAPYTYEEQQEDDVFEADYLDAVKESEEVDDVGGTEEYA